MKSIQLTDIYHSYGSGGSSEYVLSAISQIFKEGQAYALLGPSGCGKTTLLNILSGLLKPSQGKVFIGNKDVTTLPPQDRNITQIFQFPVVYEGMSVYDNLSFPLRVRKYSKQVIRETVLRIAEILDLTSILEYKAGGLGPDKKQVIALGRGLVREDVNAILLDEALTAVYPYEKWIFRRKLKEIQRQYNHVMIYVTHDQSEALTFADHVIVMNDGNVLQIDTPEQLFEYPEYKFVGYFIGSPGMNFLPVAVENGAVKFYNHLLSHLPKKTEVLGQFNNVKKWEVGIRPEYVKLTSKVSKKVSKRTSKASEPFFQVQVQDVTSLGSLKIVKVLYEGNELLAKVPDSFVLGKQLYMSFPEDKIRVYADERLVTGTKNL